VNADIHRHARRQYGLVTRPQALAAGLSSSAVDRLVQTGAWLQMAAGVYAPASVPMSWRRQVLAACLAIDGYASHRTAAALWDLSGCRPGNIHVVVAHSRSACSPPAVLHQSRVLPAGDVTTIDRIPVTRPARTLVDLAGCVPRPTLEEAVDDALCRRLVTFDRLDCRHRALRHGRKGARTLADVLTTWRDGSEPQDVAESRLLRRLRHAGLPAPTTQFDVCTADGRFVARLDAAWPEHKVGIELDGFRWHASPRAFEHDRRRRNHLVHLGWTVFQATPADLTVDGAHLAELVRPRVVRPHIEGVALCRPA
jgi:very-short-patch-repair endonuclease